MGKPTGEDQARDDPEADNPGLLCCRCCCDGLRGALTLRCALVLLLGACAFLSALFWLPPFTSGSAAAGDAGNMSASIQASFILQRPTSFVAAYTGRLEYDIFDEIGVPNTKVSIISMHQSTTSKSTYVVFGILPDSKYAIVSPVVLSVLRSSLIELVLHKSNLSLTSSIFGKPSSFEVLKFPGGITVIPDQSVPIWQITQILFNFTLNNSIVQVQKNLDELKGQLKFGLNLRSYENVYVQMTNLNGSTVAPPVIVEASVLSNVGSRILLPTRLKQLAQIITGTPAKNLGLDHSVFGRVKEVRLSSYLNNSITSLESPSPAPSPSYEPHHSSIPPVSTYPVLSPSSAPAPSTDSSHASGCLKCGISSPLGSPSPVPAQAKPETPLAQYPRSTSPSPSSSVITAHAPRQSPCLFPRLPPDNSPVVHFHPPISSISNDAPYAAAPSLQKPLAPATKAAPSPQRPMGPAPEIVPDLSPSMSPTIYSMSPRYGRRSGKATNSSMFTSPNSPSPLSNVAAPPSTEMWLVGLLGIWILHHI